MLPYFFVKKSRRNVLFPPTNNVVKNICKLFTTIKVFNQFHMQTDLSTNMKLLFAVLFLVLNIGAWVQGKNW